MATETAVFNSTTLLDCLCKHVLNIVIVLLQCSRQNIRRRAMYVIASALLQPVSTENFYSQGFIKPQILSYFLYRLCLVSD